MTGTGFSVVTFNVRSSTAAKVSLPPVAAAALLCAKVLSKPLASAAAVTGAPSEKKWPAASFTVHSRSPVRSALSASSGTSLPSLSTVNSVSPTPWLTSAQPAEPLVGSVLPTRKVAPTRSASCANAWLASASAPAATTKPARADLVK